MLRFVLQRLAGQRRIAELLEAVPLDEVLRRMQSSSLTNPARCLEAHFVWATAAVVEKDPIRPGSSTATAAAVTPAALHGTPLRNALSERLVAEVRRHRDVPGLTLEDSGLMLANCLRHRLSPSATQEVFALWLGFLSVPAAGNRTTATTAAAAAAVYSTDPTPPSLLGWGKPSNGPRHSRNGGGGEGADGPRGAFAQFQSVVRVMEACMDAGEALVRCRRTLSAAPLAVTAMTAEDAESLGFTLDDWAALMGAVEHHWMCFKNYGASTIELLVQFLALALAATDNSAASAPVAADVKKRFTPSLGRLGYFQTDRTLLRRRLFDLCERAVDLLCAAAATTEVAACSSDAENANVLVIHPWWHRPQELVRLSRAMRLIAYYEGQQLHVASSGDREVALRRPPSLWKSPDRGRDVLHLLDEGGRRVRQPFRGTSRSSVGTEDDPPPSGDPRRRTPHRLPPTSTSSTRWLPRLSPGWWSASPALAFSFPGGVASRRGEVPTARVARRLATYVALYSMRHTPAPAASSRMAVTAAALSLTDVAEVFATVCTTSEDVTRLSWWVSDLLHERYGQRGVHDAREMSGLLGITEVCVAHPDGTQTVLAEVLKCLQRSAVFLWQPGDMGATSSAECTDFLWSRASRVVGSTLNLATVRTEGQRTLQALARAAAQVLPHCGADVGQLPDGELRCRRYALSTMVCQLLEASRASVTPMLLDSLHTLVMATPFHRDAADHGGLAAAVRTLYIFTRPAGELRDSSPSLTAARHAAIVPYTLNEMARLLEPPSCPRTAKREPEEGEGGGGEDEFGVRCLQQLTSRERRWLRQALWEVRRTTLPDGAGASTSVSGTCGMPGATVGAEGRVCRSGTASAVPSSPSTRLVEDPVVQVVTGEAVVAARSPSPLLPSGDTRDGKWIAEPPPVEEAWHRPHALDDPCAQRERHTEERLLQSEVTFLARHLRAHRAPPPPCLGGKR